MEPSVNKILVIADQLDEQLESAGIALSRALSVAKSQNYSLHIVQFVHDNLRGHQNPEALINQVIERVSAKLNQSLKSQLDDKVNYSFEVVWHKHIHQWVEQYCNSHHPKLVVKTGHRSEHVFYTSTDWHLLRECSSPVLISEEHRWRNSKNILAAVDLETNNTSKLLLNSNVIKQAKALVEPGKNDLFICYAPPVSNLLRDFGMQYTDEVQAQAKVNTQEEILKLSEEFEIPLENFIVHAGQPEKVIPSMAAKVNAGIVVIGTTGRTGISGKVIGNTAEKILGLLRTDILAIKS